MIHETPRRVRRDRYLIDQAIQLPFVNGNSTPKVHKSIKIRVELSSPLNKGHDKFQWHTLGAPNLHSHLVLGKARTGGDLAGPRKASQ